MRIISFLPGLAMLALSGTLGYIYSCGMESYEVINDMSEMRKKIAIYYNLNGKPFPEDFGEIIKTGVIREVPPVKLKGHLKMKGVENSASMTYSDSGGWKYVSDPKDKDFGKLYLDCTHTDEYGRSRTIY